MKVQYIQKNYSQYIPQETNQNISFKRKPDFVNKIELFCIYNKTARKIVRTIRCINPKTRKEIIQYKRAYCVYSKYGDEWIRQWDVPNSCKGGEDVFLIKEKGYKPEIIPADKYLDYIYGNWRPEPVTLGAKLKEFLANMFKKSNNNIN